MVEAKDLRIGNLVKITGKAPALQFMPVLELRGDSIIALDKLGFKFGMTYSQAEGIPLTPELLQKTGFVETSLGKNICFILGFKRPDSDDIQHDIILVDFQEVKPEIQGQYAVAIKEYDRNIQFAVTYIKNFHQLQNFYHALTGEELTINI